MRDMKQGINKAIDSYDEHGVSVELTDHEKELIEYGYVQCALQIGCDIVTKGESFMAGLQKMVVENDALKAELKHATEQWNIWCKAYNELADNTNQLPFE
jgi:hypothetical protein